MQEFLEDRILHVDPDFDDRPPVARARAWLPAIVMVGVALIVALVFCVVVLIRTGDFPSDIPAGQAWTDSSDTTFVVTSIEVRHQMLGILDDVQRPVPGAVWVVVQMDVTGVNDDSVCTSFSLHGRDNMKWVTALSNPQGEYPSYCSPEDATDGAQTVQLVYQVPQAEVAHLQGVVQGHPMQVRQPPVLRPQQ